MIKLFHIIPLLFLPLVNCYSQVIDDFPYLTGKDIPEARFTITRTFNGESLYGYIDGGADLYLEYGFSEVTVTEFTVKKGKYKVEIYKMNDQESALGIFSVSRFRCNSKPDFAAFTCLNRYQLQICRGIYYISIVNESGTPSDSAMAVRVGKVLSAKISGQDADITLYIPDVSAKDLFENSRPYLVKGRLGLINGTPDLDVYFKGFKGYSALILDEKGNYFVSVRFSSASVLGEFGTSHGWSKELSKNEFFKMPEGEYVRMVSDTHVMIVIPRIVQSPVLN